MATHGTRPMTDMEIYNESDIVKSFSKVWMIDGNIYKVYSRDRAAGLITLLNKHTNELYTILWTDFVRLRKKVYPVPRVADLLNRSESWVKREIWYGNFPPPTYPTPDKKKIPGKKSWAVYNEDQVFELRNIMLERRLKKKDGLPSSKASIIPSVQELRRRMGIGMLAYTRTMDGRFIPIWQESV